MKVDGKDVLLVAFCGRKGSGKNTAADLAQTMFGGRQFAFADELKASCGRIWGLSHAQLHGALKETQDDRWGLTPREIMQRFGTEVARNIHPQTWVRNTLEVRIPAQVRRDRRWWTPWTWNHSRVTWITDCRFPNECGTVHAYGGFVVRIVRPGLPENAYSSHPSELEIDHLDVDHEIVNDGTLDQLAGQIRAYFTEAA